MAIKTLQKRLTQVGVIRLGQQLIAKKSGKPYPSKLETFRFTSPSKPLIVAVAGLYGGEVKPWQSNVGPQWEVITGAKEVPVLVPPQRIDPSMEHWGNGFRDRLCDGETESIRNQPCHCAAAAAKGRPFGARDICKPTTRMSLMLADIPSLGTWKVESHGWNAAAELPTLAASIESAPQPIPARLEVQKREKKTFDPFAKEGEQVASSVFMVPVIHFDWLTPAQAFGGQIGDAARQALTSATADRKAIAAAEAEQRKRFTPDEYIAMADDARNVEQVRALWKGAARDEALTDAVKDALNKRVAEVAPQPKPEQEDAPPAAAAPADEVVDAELVDDVDVVWGNVQAAAGDRGWGADDLERRICAFLGKSSSEANEADLARFLAAVEAGEVA